MAQSLWTKTNNVEGIQSPLFSFTYMSLFDRLYFTCYVHTAGENVWKMKMKPCHNFDTHLWIVIINYFGEIKQLVVLALKKRLVDGTAMFCSAVICWGKKETKTITLSGQQKKGLCPLKLKAKLLTNSWWLEFNNEHRCWGCVSSSSSTHFRRRCVRNT